MSSLVPEIRKVGVIGAGQMGNGIAHVFALTGYDVVLSDLEQSALDAAIETIRGNLGRQIRKDMISEEEAEAAIARIACSTTLDPFGEVDLVVEAAAEVEIHGPSFHESGAGDAAGRVNPRYRNG